jgi:general secretion pathway protein G
MQRVRRKPSVRAPRGGFTLMEVLLVLAILGVIIGLVLPNLLGQQKTANIKAAKVAINSIEQALKLYALDHDGEFPQTSQGLEALIVSPGNDSKWNGPYIEKTQTLPADPWGQPLQYAYPGSNQGGADRPDIWSMGPDKTSNTEDDITNWGTTQ